jgi:hypothetical protein
MSFNQGRDNKKVDDHLQVLLKLLRFKYKLDATKGLNRCIFVNCWAIGYPNLDRNTTGEQYGGNFGNAVWQDVS